jgi:hypothetical protein
LLEVERAATRAHQRRLRTGRLDFAVRVAARRHTEQLAFDIGARGGAIDDDERLRRPAARMQGAGNRLGVEAAVSDDQRRPGTRRRSEKRGTRLGRRRRRPGQRQRKTFPGTCGHDATA